MASCNDSSVGDILAAVLWPEEFPQERESIIRHATECPQCRRELERLEALHRSLVLHKGLLAATETGEESPAPAFSAQRPVDGIGCGEKAHESEDPNEADSAHEIVKEIESLIARPCSLTPQEKLIVEEALDRYAPRTPEAEARHTLFERCRRILRESLQPVPLILGAALASLIFVVVPFVFQENPGLMAVSSDTQWKFRRMSLMKGTPLGPAPTEAALVILTPRDRPLLSEEVAALYREIDLAQLLRKSFSFMSPEETGKIVGEESPISRITDVRDVVFQKSDVTYLLTFEVLNSFSGYAVRGTLFRRGDGHDLGSVSQTGIRFARLPARISAMTEALLEEAAQ
jgi:hypothetical protein